MDSLDVHLKRPHSLGAGLVMLETADPGRPRCTPDGDFLAVVVTSAAEAPGLVAADPKDLLHLIVVAASDGASVKIRYHSLDNLNESRAAMIERAAGMTYEDICLTLENRDILLFLGIDEPTEAEAGADTGEWITAANNTPPGHVAKILIVIEEEY
jgi:hypothetical protein